MNTGCPADGVIAQTTGEQERALAEIDPSLFEASCASAQVGSDHHWPGQLKPGLAHTVVL